MPEEGSWQETLAVLIQGIRNSERLLRTRLFLVKPGDEKAEELWSSYERSVIPFLASAREAREDEQAKEAKRLATAFASLGPMTILHNKT